MKKVFFSRQIGILSLMFNDEKTFPYVYLDLACKQLFPAKEKVNVGETKLTRHSIIMAFQPVVPILQNWFFLILSS